MSRGQKPRTPAYFPHMRDRALKRRRVIVFGAEGEPGDEVYSVFSMRRRDVPKGSPWLSYPIWGAR